MPVASAALNAVFEAFGSGMPGRSRDGTKGEGNCEWQGCIHGEYHAEVGNYTTQGAQYSK